MESGSPFKYKFMLKEIIKGFKIYKDSELEKQIVKKHVIGKSRVRKRRREGAEKRG